jgi:hypothetical protein
MKAATVMQVDRLLDGGPSASAYPLRGTHAAVRQEKEEVGIWVKVPQIIRQQKTPTDASKHVDNNTIFSGGDIP